MRRTFLVAPVLTALAAATAWCDPSIDAAVAKVAKGRRLDVDVTVTLAARGTVMLRGTVDGQAIEPVAKRVRPKAGRRRVRLSVDARKLHLSGLDRALTFELEVAAQEPGAAEATRALGPVVVPPPCIVLEGLGNELGGRAAATLVGQIALDPQVAGRYTTRGAHATLVDYGYPSLSQPLDALGRALGRRVRKALRGTVFGKVDLVGYSYGGVVARSFIAQGGASSVRRCVFLATPNEGVPLAYIGVGVYESPTLSAAISQNPDAQAALDAAKAQFGGTRAMDALRNVFPTYSWVSNLPPIFGQAILTAALGDPSTPLTALNAISPPAGVTFDAVYYTSDTGTLDVVDFSTLSDVLASPATADPAAILSGSGDGLVPARSVAMARTSNWSGHVTTHEFALPAGGSHLTIVGDATVAAEIAGILVR